MSEHMNPKIRELTYRLIAMAPDAPPFPEESMVQLKPSPAPAPARRRSPLVWVAAAATVALVLVGVPLFLFGGGDTTPTIPPASVTTLPDVTPTTTPDGVTPTTVPPDVSAPEGTTTVYLFSNELSTRLGDPALVAVRVAMPAQSTDGGPLDGIRGITALFADLDSPGYTSAVPAGTEFLGMSLEGGVLSLDLSREFESGGGTASMTARLVQVVFTATQFPDVDAVLFMIDGEVVEVFSGEGLILDGPQTRADYFGTDQLIYVDTPAIGSTVSSPISISGFANVFEANVQFEVTLADGTVIASGFTTASCGTGCWGDFAAATLYELAEDAPGFVTVFTGSPEDGSRQDVISYPVTLLASRDPEATGDAPSYLSVGFEPMVGPGYYRGRIVTSTPLTVTGGTDADATVTVAGTPVTLDEFGGFAAAVDLIEGENTIVVTASRGGQTLQEAVEVRYMPDVTIEFTYLTEVGSDEIVADYAQWLSGDEANQAAFEDGVIASVEEGVPNDYYIRNVNDQLRTLPLSGEAVIVLVNPVEIGPIEVPVAEWLALFKEDGTPWNYETDQVPSFSEPYFDYFGANTVNTPYWLYLDADGTVIHIEQQYIP